MKDLIRCTILQNTNSECVNSARENVWQTAALREALENIVEGEGLWTKNDMVHEAQQALKEVKA